MNRQLTDISESLPYLEKVRQLHPLVHCITNTVTINDCANILLAAGASPTMAHHPEETAEITAACNALVCNLGATDDYEAMINAVREAGRRDHPVVVDPVGCGGSSFRRRFFTELCSAGKISCLRGNAAEIRALARNMGTTTGVDAPDEISSASFEELKDTAFHLAEKLDTIVAVSGAVDVLTDGHDLTEIHAGHPMMSRITGSGCMLTAMTGAFLAADNSISSAAACFRIMGWAGETAAIKAQERKGGTMTFRMEMIDALSLLAL